MIHLTVMVLVILGVCECDLNQCGWTRFVSSRMSEGDNTALGQHPWVVKLESNQGESFESFDCAGSLISSRYVLTSGSCVEDALDITITLGEHNLDTNPDCDHNGRCADKYLQVNTKEYTIHPEFRSEELPHPFINTGFNDIALVRMNEPVKFTDFIQPICIGSEDENVQTLKLIGWGVATHDTVEGLQPEFDTLQSITASRVSLEDCRTAYNISQALGFTFQIEDGEVCTYDFPGNACQRNNGSPLVYTVNGRTYQLGVYSEGVAQLWCTGSTLKEVGLEEFKGIPNVPDSLPDIYTSVPYYYNWIFDNMY